MVKKTGGGRGQGTGATGEEAFGEPGSSVNLLLQLATWLEGGTLLWASRVEMRQGGLVRIKQDLDEMTVQLAIAKGVRVEGRDDD